MSPKTTSTPRFFRSFDGSDSDFFASRAGDNHRRGSGSAEVSGDQGLREVGQGYRRGVRGRGRERVQQEDVRGLETPGIDLTSSETTEVWYV